jgi:hypothetical protein
VSLENNLREKLVALLGLNWENLDANSALGRFILVSGNWIYFRAMSNAAEYIFGLLMNCQWSVFPDLPVPIWVWDS